MDHKENIPLISVIIPAYNAEKTILRACGSVLSQDYGNVELIVVDDGSKDSTGAIMAELQSTSANVRCIRQENGGVCKARNTGMEHAAGEYLFFLDADDELTPGSLSRLYAVAVEQDCDIVEGCCVRVYPDGSFKKESYDLDGSAEIWTGKDALRHSLEDHPATYAVWGKLYRKTAVGQVRFAEGKRIHEDSFFLFEVFLRQPKMAVVNDIVVNYYMTQSSASRAAFSDKFLDILYFARRKYEIIEQSCPEWIPLGKNVLVKGSMALLKNMWKPGAEKYRDVERQCQKTVRENARYFISTSKADRAVFTAVRLHLFWLYKWAYRILRGR